MGLQAGIMSRVAGGSGRKGDYKVRFGKVLSLEDTVVSGQLYDFTAGRVRLKGKKFVSDFLLSGFASGAMLTDDIASLFDENMDAVWAHSRILHDFKTTSLATTSVLRGAMMEFHFLAIEQVRDDVQAFPFVFTDFNGQAALVFSPYGPGQAIQRMIASDFWHVLLQEPQDLFDFEAQSVMAGTVLNFGRGRDRFYYEEG